MANHLCVTDISLSCMFMRKPKNPIQLQFLNMHPADQDASVHAQDIYIYIHIYIYIQLISINIYMLISNYIYIYMFYSVHVNPDCVVSLYSWHWWLQAAWLRIWVALSSKRNSRLSTLGSDISITYHFWPSLKTASVIRCHICLVTQLGELGVGFTRSVGWLPPISRRTLTVASKVEHCLQTASL